MADGPATWGTPVRSNRSGVYLVEQPAALSAAPIDFNTLGRWIERVPTLTVDGVQPTGRDLAARLHRFWLADQTVLYIGMSAVSIGARVSAYYRTPLGDRRPHAGGYWLKTLNGLERMRVWWADTDAPEEYEDALLTAFAAGVAPEIVAGLLDPALVLPFANLQTADRIRKTHGIAGALLADEKAAPATDADRRAAAAQGGKGGRSDPTRSTGVLRSRTVLGSAGRGANPRTNRQPPRMASPMSSTSADGPRRRLTAAPTVGSKAKKAPTQLSDAGRETLVDELAELTTVARPAIVARIAAARELGDLKENSDYHEARREQSFAEGRIRAIEDLLRNVVIIEGGADEGRARLGSTVIIEGPHGDEETYTLVGPTEANPAAGRISANSPIGAAILGGTAGDEVEAVVPSGRLRMRIIAVR